MKKKLYALAGGLAGACTLSLLHQALRRTVPSVAPRMDLLGMEAMTKIREAAGLPVPPEDELYKQTFIGDLACNTLYYSLVGGGRVIPQLKGLLLGTAAGLGAVQLPEKLHLNPAHSNRTEATKYMAIGIYVAGGVAAAVTVKLLNQLSHS